MNNNGCYCWYCNTYFRPKIVLNRVERVFCIWRPHSRSAAAALQCCSLLSGWCRWWPWQCCCCQEGRRIGIDPLWIPCLSPWRLPLIIIIVVAIKIATGRGAIVSWRRQKTVVFFAVSSFSSSSYYFSAAAAVVCYCRCWWQWLFHNFEINGFFLRICCWFLRFHRRWLFLRSFCGGFFRWLLIVVVGLLRRVLFLLFLRYGMPPFRCKQPAGRRRSRRVPAAFSGSNDRWWDFWHQVFIPFHETSHPTLKIDRIE